MKDFEYTLEQKETAKDIIFSYPQYREKNLYLSIILHDECPELNLRQCSLLIKESLFIY